MLSRLVHQSLSTKIAPMIYVTMGVSLFIGFCFATGLFVMGAESVLYGTGVLIDKQIWGVLLLCSATAAEIGFFTDNDGIIALGGSLGFMAWLFACLALTMTGHWYILITVALFHLVFHGYVVLATSQGYIRRSTIETH